MIVFGTASLRGYRNAIETGCAVTTGAGNTGLAIASGAVYLDGIKCVLSAVTVALAGGAGTGTGGYLYATLPAGNTSTAAATASLVDPTGTLFATLDRYSFGTAANNATLLTGAGGNSATTALTTFGRAQNVTVNITYDQAIARGGTLIFGTNTKFYNGAIEGNAEYAEINVEEWARLWGGSYASAAAASGTWTLSATNKPFPFMLEATTVTDGDTATVTLLKCYSNQLVLKMDRESFLVPNFNFVAIANQIGDIIKIEN